MKIHHRLLVPTLMYSLQVLAPCAQAAPPSNSANTAVSNAARTQYLNRVQTIAKDLRWSSAALFTSLERYELRSGQLQKPTRNMDVETVMREATSSKSTLIENLKRVRANAHRLRAISPVPRAWKKADDKLADAAWEWELGVSALETWLLHPSDETQNNALKHLRRAQTVFDSAQRDLSEKSDPVLAAKKYFN